MDGHVTLEVECVDRLYLNGYIPSLATPAGLTAFLREHLGKPMPEKGAGWFEYTRNKTVYVNHYYFYVDDEEFGPVFVKVCSYAPWL